MGDWLVGLPVVWMGVVILGLTYLATAAIYVVVMRLATGERARAFTAISAGMLSPLAIVFALLLGFLAAQVWGETQRASAAVNQEAGALRSVVLLAAAFPGEPQLRLRELVRRHIHNAVTLEWPSMARRSATLTLIPAPLAEALQVSFGLDARSTGQVAAQREIVASLQSALEARRQRIILSHSSINWVKWTTLLVQAGLTLLTIAMIHSGNRTATRIIMVIFATGVAVTVVLLASNSRPFAGEISVRPTVLLRVMPEGEPEGESERGGR